MIHKKKKKLVDPSFEVGILSPMENEDVFLGKQFFLKKNCPVIFNPLE
jgi:hypothetical protein